MQEKRCLMKSIRQISEFSNYTALAFIFGYIESLIPLPLPFPGMKLGLANLIIMIVLYRNGLKYAFGIAMLRNILNAFTFGSLFSFFYSLAGSLLSLFAMGLLRRWKHSPFSVVSVSALGGILHNIGQLLIAAFLVGFSSILWYVPILYFCGLVTGILIGILSAQCLMRLPGSPVKSGTEADK